MELGTVEKQKCCGSSDQASQLQARPPSVSQAPTQPANNSSAVVLCCAVLMSCAVLSHFTTALNNRQAIQCGAVPPNTNGRAASLTAS
jgi:hypothetical protein